MNYDREVLKPSHWVWQSLRDTQKKIAPKYHPGNPNHSLMRWTDHNIDNSFKLGDWFKHHEQFNARKSSPESNYNVKYQARASHMYDISPSVKAFSSNFSKGMTSGKGLFKSMLSASAKTGINYPGHIAQFFDKSFHSKEMKRKIGIIDKLTTQNPYVIRSIEESMVGKKTLDKTYHALESTHDERRHEDLVDDLSYYRANAVNKIRGYQGVMTYVLQHNYSSDHNHTGKNGTRPIKYDATEFPPNHIVNIAYNMQEDRLHADPQNNKVIDDSLKRSMGNVLPQMILNRYDPSWSHHKIIAGHEDTRVPNETPRQTIRNKYATAMSPSLSVAQNQGTAWKLKHTAKRNWKQFRDRFVIAHPRLTSLPIISKKKRKEFAKKRADNVFKQLGENTDIVGGKSSLDGSNDEANNIDHKPGEAHTRGLTDSERLLVHNDFNTSQAQGLLHRTMDKYAKKLGFMGKKSKRISQTLHKSRKRSNRHLHRSRRRSHQRLSQHSKSRTMNGRTKQRNNAPTM